MQNFIITILFFLVEINVLEIERYRLNITAIAPIYWIDNKRIFVNEEDEAFLYDIVERDIIRRYKKNKNELLGFENNTVLRCNWENRSIQSPDEYSTHLRVEKSSGEKLINIELKPTAEVIECRTNPILKTLFPIEEKFFTFTEQLYELQTYNQDILSPNISKLIHRDNWGNYWITRFSF